MSNQNNNRMNNVDLEGVTGGVFSFPLMSLFGNNANNGSGNDGSDSNNNNDNNNNNNNNNNQAPQPTFTNLADIIGTAINSTVNPAGNNNNNTNTTNNNNNNNNNNNHGPGLANGLTNFIQNIVEDFAANLSTRPPKRHFSKEALKLIKPLKLSELPKGDEKCPICYDPFEEYDPESLSNNSSTSNNATTRISESAKHAESIANLGLPDFLKAYDPEDPSVSFPLDETAAYQNSYNLSFEPSLVSLIPPPRSSFSSNNHDHISNGEHHHPDLDDNDLHYAVQLPQCDHIFGRSCIIEWLKSNVSCPLCRREIMPELTETDQTNRRNSDRIVYDTALTETFVPVDWTGPISSGYVLNDPSVSFPIRSHGISIGRRTGVSPDLVNNSDDVNDDNNNDNTFENQNNGGDVIDVEVEILPISNTHSDLPVNDLLNDLD